MSNVLTKVVRPNFEVELKEMGGMIIDGLFKINEMSRILIIKPENTIELTNEIQRIEMEVNKKYRKLTIKALDQITLQEDLFLLKDTIESIEWMVNKFQQASNPFTILALSI
jgi:uncharacterized protein